MKPFEAASLLEDARTLDRVVGPIRSVTRSVLRSALLRDFRHGVWLGPPLHPVLVQVPVGAFASAGVAVVHRNQASGNDGAQRPPAPIAIPRS